MIEIEKKFILTDKQTEALVNGAEFLAEKIFTDIYYDDKNYSLTKNDIWLRSRAGKFELKIPMNDNISFENRKVDRYRELENDKEILNYFNASNEDSLASFLIKKEYNSFCSIETSRKKYKKEGFNIDLDIMNFGYTIAEIEYMTNDESSVTEATEAIIAFAEKHGIKSDNVVLGKVLEYLRRNNQEHFKIVTER